jgi:hypothetical protein
MRFLVRQDDQQSRALTSEPVSRIDAVRLEGSQLLSAGDDAIRQALDGSSESFLRASRQEGGE